MGRTPLFLLIFPFDLRSLLSFILLTLLIIASCTHKLKLFDYSSCGHKLKHLTYKVRPVAPPTLGTVGDGPPRDGPGLGATNGCAWARWEAPATRPGRGRHHNETRAPRVGLSRVSQAHIARSQRPVVRAHIVRALSDGFTLPHPCGLGDGDLEITEIAPLVENTSSFSSFMRSRRAAP